MTNFTDNEQQVTYPTGPITEPPVEDFPVAEIEVVEEETREDISSEPYERAVLPPRKPRDKAKKYIVLSIISAVIVVALITGFAFYYVTATSRIRNLESQVEDLEFNNTMLTEKNAYAASEYEQEIDALEEEISLLEMDIEELSVKVDFMDSSIRVVEDDGYKTYHVYGCEYFDSEYYWAYNKNQVVNNSEYTRCPYCN